MDTLIYFILGFFGVICHCLMKSDSLAKDAKSANIDFSFSQYLKADWRGIALSFISIFIWFLLFEETAKQYPRIEDWIRASFFGMGFFGSYIIQTINSKSKKVIRNIIDEKTNIADSIPKTN